MDDSALVAAIARRDPQCLEGAYRRYADPLYAYARGLIGDGDSAADIVHDTFLLASEHVSQLRDPARLRSWLYAIARHEGLRQLKKRKRHTPLEFAPDIAADQAEPSTAAQAAEVAELVRAAMAGMSETDREVAELALRHGLVHPRYRVRARRAAQQRPRPPVARPRAADDRTGCAAGRAAQRRPL